MASFLNSSASSPSSTDDAAVISGSLCKILREFFIVSIMPERV